VLIGSIPPTGIPLPFVSAGGSGLVVFMSAIGVLLNIANNDSCKNMNLFKGLKFFRKNKKVIKGAY
jgi:cell division protein FtsW (lipid II flippase)